MSTLRVNREERELARQAKAWPFAEARKLVDRLAAVTREVVTFETGYGPSGLPHIGTFGEVVRTTMVRQAFARLSDRQTRLVTFSDDMDGLRKVPDNIPNRDMVAEHLGKPLTAIPDPFGTHESFGHHNNARLRAFLDQFGFDYEFLSSTDCYRSGRFDAALRAVLEHYDAVTALILPTLGPERRATYSPFLPICPRTGRVLQVPLLGRDVDAASITYADPETAEPVSVPVTGGHCKLQWKADWAMRWRALEVDYEMYGKDLIPSAELAGKIVEVLGGRQPEGFNYELFLDENGEKISKSKGNGLTVEEWLRYAPQASLALYMYQSPRKAKRLTFDVIPRAVDEYRGCLDRYAGETPAQRLENPAWHIHDGVPPTPDTRVSFGLLLNLASACHAHDRQVLWGFINRYAPDASPATSPFLDALVGFAVHYYEDFVEPTQQLRRPDAMEAQALRDLARELAALPAEADAEAFQSVAYEVGKRHPFKDLRSWFQTVYETLLGQSRGPRLGSFIALYGRDETVELIQRVLAAEAPPTS